MEGKGRKENKINKFMLKIISQDLIERELLENYVMDESLDPTTK